MQLLWNLAYTIYYMHLVLVEDTNVENSKLLHGENPPKPVKTLNI